MASVGQWELVVKGSKKKNVSVVNGKLSKNEKKQFSEHAPKINKYGLVANTQGSEGKENKQPKQASTNQQSHESKKKKHDKKKDDTPRQPHDLEEAISKISLDDVKNLVDVVIARFKDAPLIWLKDLASYLNVRINPSAGRDPAFRQDPSDYPLALLDPEVRKLFFSTLSGCSDQVLEAFHQHCVTSMVHEIPKGLPVYGYKLFLQLLAQYKPEICLSNLHEYCKLRQHYQSQSPPTLSLMWAVGQAGKKNFAYSLRIWLELMFPLIGLKNYSAYVIDYGSNMFIETVVTDQDYSDILNVRAFFSIFDFIWASSSSLPKLLQRDLFNLYPKFKTVVMNRKCDLHSLFPSFLHRLEGGTSVQLRQEILSCLTQCLTQHPHCWTIWNQLYLKHLPQSALLLQHINLEWSATNGNPLLYKEEVKQAIFNFKNTNEKLQHKVHAIVGIKEATLAAHDLAELMDRHTKSYGLMRWKNLLLIFIILFITWDLKTSKSFADSTIGGYLDRLGLTVYFETVGRSCRKGLAFAYKWCWKNVPFYYSRCCELAGPYLLMFIERFTIIFNIVYETMSSLLHNVAQYVPTVIEKVENMMPGSSDYVKDLFHKTISTIHHLWSELSQVMTPYLQQIHHFFVTKILIGPLEPQYLYQLLVETSRYMADSAVKTYSIIIKMLNEE